MSEKSRLCWFNEMLSLARTFSEIDRISTVVPRKEKPFLLVLIYTSIVCLRISLAIFQDKIFELGQILHLATCALSLPVCNFQVVSCMFTNYVYLSNDDPLTFHQRDILMVYVYAAIKIYCGNFEPLVFWWGCEWFDCSTRFKIHSQLRNYHEDGPFWFDNNLKLRSN